MYHRYLPVTINGVHVDALVDSGNTWRNVISLSFLRALRIDEHRLRPVDTGSVSTARHGAQMEVLGELPKPICMTPQGTTLKLWIQPAVLRDLSMPVNLSGPFLKEQGLDQIHSQNALDYKGQLLPLKSHPTEEQNRVTWLPEPEGAVAVLTEDVTVPPYSQATVSVQVPAILKGQFPQGDGVVYAGDGFRQGSNLCPALCALVAPDKDGQFLTKILNTDRQAITVKKDTEYGVFRLACRPEEQDRFPCRVAVIASINDGKSATTGARPTLRQKLIEAVRKSQMAAKEEPKKKTLPKTDDEKLKWIFKEFRLSDSPCLKTKKDKDRAAALLLKYWDCLSVDGEFGKTTLMQHEIHTEPGPPIKTRYRPVNPSLEGDLKKQLSQWEAHDVIEPSNSPWSFALVAAPKKNGKIRWCVDFRRLNAITRKDTFPLPHIEDNLVRLSDSAVFSCVDGSGAFHVLEIRECDREKTAFSTPWGLYQYKRMPFGLTNGPASYSRLVQMVLQGIPPEMALPYLDDTIIHSADVESHFRCLELVLDAHLRAGLKLQPAKCQLFHDQVEYLGHLISKRGVQPLPDYVKAVQDWRLPTTKSEARVFLGKVGYYRRFIKNYAAIARPWMEVTGKTTDEAEKTPLQISPEMETSFNDLKSRLLSAPILAYPRFRSTEPFILDTDWSQEAGAIGGVLSQVQDGKERVIAYGAKKMSSSQLNYTPGKGEMAAVLHFVQHWSYYLRYRPLHCPDRP